MDTWAAFRLFLNSVDPFRDRATTGRPRCPGTSDCASGVDRMSWLPPVPPSAVDSAGQTWQIHRAWPAFTPGDYLLEVVTPGQPGVRGARLRDGRFELLPDDDPGLPALRAEARHGEIVSHRPHIRAVIRAEALLHQGLPARRGRCPCRTLRTNGTSPGPPEFRAPRLLRSSPDVIVFSAHRRADPGDRWPRTT